LHHAILPASHMRWKAFANSESDTCVRLGDWQAEDMILPSDSRGLRDAAIRWLDERPQPRVDFGWLAQFEYQGRRVPLMDRQRGIRKPAGMDAALAIRTTFTAPNQLPPYNDEIGTDGLQRYKYRGTDPDHPENVALRRAMEQRLPLIWFVGVASGLYEPIYPVYVIGEERGALQFALAVDEGQRFITPGSEMDEVTRRYVERVTKARLHQRVFRMQVLLAYTDSCAVCRLKHPELLDAAHIIGDAEDGEPVVPNGMSMCKIHHAAFDQNFLGVSPDLRIEINSELMAEVDGPMLKHGLQEMHGTRLHTPTSRAQRPDRERLAARYEAFLAV
jgi:putative restriction endonuclease